MRERRVYLTVIRDESVETHNRIPTHHGFTDLIEAIRFGEEPIDLFPKRVAWSGYRIRMASASEFGWIC